MADCSSTYDLGPVAGERRRAALVLLVSALLVAVVGAATYLVDADLSGVRPSFGSGVDPGLGNRVVRDFTADHEAEARALSSGDQSQLENRLTGNALQDVAQQISSNASAATTPMVTFRPTSLSVIQARDPNDPSVVIEVREDGVKTLVTTYQNAAPTEQSVTFHGDFWMRESNGRYLITDQTVEVQPSSPLPALAVAALALLAVAAAGLLVRRSRSGLAFLPAPPRASTSPPSVAPTQAAGLEAQPAELVVRTFGGLHLMQGGKDWVQALEQRPVTGFVWQRLLIGAIRDPASRPSREELTRQVGPALDRKTRLKRMRNVVYHGLRELPAVLKDRILVEPQALGFKLEGCDVDAVNLIKASTDAAGRETLAPSETVWAQRVYDESAGIFLPDFEKVEDFATDHHPTCTDLVKEVRGLLASKRADLATALADTYLASGRSAQAIAALEPVVREHPNRKDLAVRLAAAYRSAGRDAEAKALLERFA
jgi:DNA-binding SARP family transcriptional activator